MSTQSSDYKVGWLCVKDVELTAAKVMLDEKYPNELTPEINTSQDVNSYTFGRVGGHHVVLVVLPEGVQGKSAATLAAERMMKSFPKIEIRLMTGIAGGAPTTSNEMRLGDVVISVPTNGQAGVLEYDHGQTIQQQEFMITGHMDKPSTNVLNAVTSLKSKFYSDGNKLAETVQSRTQNNPRLRKRFFKPEQDRLYQAEYDHNKQQPCDCQNTNVEQVDIEKRSKLIVDRPDRTEEEDGPKVHYGLIASADNVMKDAITRNKLTDKHGVLCFEKEAAGLMNGFPTLVIRGISDYADSHKNDCWQAYAAAVAAAYARALLEIMPGDRNIRTFSYGSSKSNTQTPTEGSYRSLTGQPAIGWHDNVDVGSSANRHQEMILELQSRRRTNPIQGLHPLLRELRENKDLFAEGIDYWSYMTFDGYVVYERIFEVMCNSNDRRDIIWFATCLGNANPGPDVLMAMWERFRYNPVDHKALPDCFIIVLLYMLHVEVFSSEIRHERPEMNRDYPRELESQLRKRLRSSRTWVSCISPPGCPIRWNYMSQEWGIPCFEDDSVPNDCLAYKRYKEREDNRHVAAAEDVPTHYSIELNQIMNGIHRQLREEWYSSGWREKTT